MIVESGKYRIEIGSGSADIRCSKTVEISGIWEAPLAAVYVSIDSQILRQGQSGRLRTSVTLKDAKHLNPVEYKLKYESTNPDVVTVDNNGIVTAHAFGAASVLVTACYKGSSMSRKIPFAVR